MPVLHTIGKRMQNIRQRLGLTQEQVATKTGISLTHYGNLERGERTPSLENLIAIANAFQCDANALLYDCLAVFERSPDMIASEPVRKFFMQEPAELR